MNIYNISKTDFIRLLNNNSELTAHGFGVDDPITDNFNTERQNLFNMYNEFLVCCKFLKQLGMRDTINNCTHSYRLKHNVERWAKSKKIKPNYIPEGAFVAAAIFLGFKYSRIPKTRSIRLNISSKSIVDGRPYKKW